MDRDYDLCTIKVGVGAMKKQFPSVPLIPDRFLLRKDGSIASSRWHFSLLDHFPHPWEDQPERMESFQMRLRLAREHFKRRLSILFHLLSMDTDFPTIQR